MFWEENFFRHLFLPNDIFLCQKYFFFAFDMNPESNIDNHFSGVYRSINHTSTNHNQMVLIFT